MTAQQSTGIEFSEKMEGPFAQGATEPSKGKSKGKSDSTKMAMRGKITIADIDRFIEDPDHVGELTGSIEFTPFGTPKVGKNRRASCGTCPPSLCRRPGGRPTDSLRRPSARGSAEPLALMAPPP